MTKRERKNVTENATKKGSVTENVVEDEEDDG